MKISEKIAILEKDHFDKWLETRRLVADQISEAQSMFCVCGRLATGLHENGCKKLQQKITSETVKRLEAFIGSTPQ